MNVCKTLFATASWFALGIACAAAADAPGFTAGAGEAVVDVTPDMLPLEGFTSVRDPLQARVVLLGNGTMRAAIARLDLPAIGADVVSEMQKIVAREAGLDPANVWVVAGHSFSTPHVWGQNKPPFMSKGPEEAARGQRYDAAVLAALAEAATQAAHTVRPARTGFGSGQSNVNVNRNMPTADGWGLGPNDDGPSDKSLQVLRIEDTDHRPIAVLLNYAVQSAVFEPARAGPASADKAATPDLGGAAAHYVETALDDGVISMFLTGAAGDQIPAYTARRSVLDKDGQSHVIDIGGQGNLLLELQAERLGTEAVRVTQDAVAGPSPPVLQLSGGSVQLDAQARPANLAEIRPTKTYEFKVSGKSAAPYYFMQIGDVVLVGVQAEIFAATGVDIRRRSPFAHTMVMTMVNGSAKYLPDADGYQKITYEAINSSYGPGSAEILEAKILHDLKALHDRSTK